MMFCQKEEIDLVLGNHKGACDHLVLFSQETSVFGFLILL